MNNAGLNCPKPIKLKKHVFLMSFIGTDEKAAPKLKDVQWADETSKMTAFEQIRSVGQLLGWLQQVLVDDSTVPRVPASARRSQWVQCASRQRWSVSYDRCFTSCGRVASACFVLFGEGHWERGQFLWTNGLWRIANALFVVQWDHGIEHEWRWGLTKSGYSHF